jgi:hypothetical protein
MIMNLLHSLRQWFEIALVVAIAGFLFIHFVLSPPKSITLPGGQVINLDTKSFNASVKEMLKKQDENGKKVNDLESQVRILQNDLSGKAIPTALKETNIRASVERMKAAW